MKLPKHIGCIIRHNQHALYYETVEDYLARPGTDEDVSAGDRMEMIRTGEVWEIQWYPGTPVGFCVVYAPTLERALELAKADEPDK